MAIVRRVLEPILANVVEASPFVFTAGAIADDLTLDIEGQAREAFRDLDTFLGMCGSSKAHILWATIWLADIRLRDRMNTQWLAWIDPANLPARACIEGKMADAECLFEIQVIAAKA
ncbi:MAG: RidA family protein [Hyphomicrobiaceae bacterium]|nr:RidA family protein [Hyphomicrobiaceae bacterium]